MTIIIAQRFLKSVAIFADCRISYGDGKPVDDALQKLYPLDEKIVIGFAGPLAGAYQVLETVRKNRLSYSKPSIAANLMADVERWIRHAYRQIKPREYRKGLSFILASVEPKREMHSRWFTQEGFEKPKPNWFPYVPELRIDTFEPSQRFPGELIKSEKGMSKIIGVPEQIQVLVEKQLLKMYGFAFKQPELQAQAVLNRMMYILMESGIKTVGGLFQGVVLSKNGLKWLSYGLPSKYGDVTLEIVDGQYFQRDNITRRVVPLMTIWQWMNEKPQPGQFGVVEDPAYRKVIDELRQKGLNSEF